MNDAMTLLGRALRLLEQEMKDMAAGDIEAAEEKFNLRSKLMDDAWESRHTASKDEFRSVLQQIYNMQEQLTADTINFKEALRAQLAKSRQESRRISGYRKSVEQAVQYQ